MKGTLTKYNDRRWAYKIGRRTWYIRGSLAEAGKDYWFEIPGGLGRKQAEIGDMTFSATFDDEHVVSMSDSLCTLDYFCTYQLDCLP